LFSEHKIAEQMMPLLKRVLIIDPNVATTRLISDTMRDVMRSQVWTATGTDRALKLANNVNPDVIFVEFLGDGIDGLEFTKQLRRSRYACRKTAIIMVTGHATQGTLLAARDAGVHEFLCKPFSMKELMRRLEAVTLRSRDWVEAMNYIGPDRRRFNSGDYAGPRKRACDTTQLTDQERIGQALKILKSAIAGVETEPAQAIRSMETQAEDLRRVATFMADASLAHAAKDFQGYLATASANGATLHMADLERHAEPLMRYMPPDKDRPRVNAA
jgi:DNA-binding response OmpR family regulator